MQWSGRLTGFVLAVCVWTLSVGVAVAGPVQSPEAVATSATAPASITPSVTAEPAATPAEEPAAPVTATTALSSFSRVQDDHPWLRWGGAWTVRSGAAFLGHGARSTKSKGAWASATFSGTGAAIVTRVGPDRGRMRVYVDGVGHSTVSLFATSTASGVVIWSVTGLRPGKHTVKAVVDGSHVPASAGDWVEIDEFRVSGALVSPGRYPGARVHDTDSRLAKRGTWTKLKRKSAFGDTVIRSSKAGASVTLKFKGTGVTWYGRKDSSSGNATVWLDGKKVGTISQYSPVAGEPRVVWTARKLKNKTHTLTIKNAGPAVAGGGSRIEIDELRVDGTALFAPRATPFKYPWRTYIVIDKSSFKLYWVKNKVLRKIYPIAHGKPGWATPERVWRIDAKYHTSPGSVYGPRKMRMFKRVKTSRGNRYVFTAYAIHGTNQEWVIGTRASHGCIRMYNKDVRELFPQVPYGTMVVTRN